MPASTSPTQPTQVLAPPSSLSLTPKRMWWGAASCVERSQHLELEDQARILVLPVTMSVLISEWEPSHRLQPIPPKELSTYGPGTEDVEPEGTFTAPST